MSENKKTLPGLVALFGSGETTPSGRKIFDQVFRQLPSLPQVAILETPAGFELNSPQVAGRVGNFLRRHLKNYRPKVTIVAARRRGTPFSPNNTEAIAPLWSADLVFMGPGSPTYAVRQLNDSLAWQTIQARHRLGMSIALASAATVAISAYAIPVYEIYKVGEDIHWKDGLNLFEPYGLSLVFVPHWNNNDGGDELDTSRCYMGKTRFRLLLEMLPGDVTVIGIDEQTGLLVDLVNEVCQVVGTGGITLTIRGKDRRFETGMAFAITELGDFHFPEPAKGLPQDVWEQAILRKQSQEMSTPPPDTVIALVKQREAARQSKNWMLADDLRDQILGIGWQVLDTNDGPVLEKIERDL